MAATGAPLTLEDELQREYDLSLIETVNGLTFQAPIEVLPATKRTEELQLRKMELLKSRKEAAEAAKRAKEQEEAARRMKEQDEKKKRAAEKRKEEEEMRKKREEEEQRKQLEGGMDRILETLQSNTSEPSINLCGIELGSVHLRMLAGALKLNQSCEAVDFGRKGLGDEDGFYLAEMLKENTFLEKLELEGNNVGAKSGKAFGEALATNEHLRCLSLESNNITCSGSDQNGVFAIARALKTNRSLRVLNLARNHITLQGGDELVACIQQNDTVTLVDLSGNELSTDQLRRVDAVVQANRARQSVIRRAARRERFALFGEEFASKQYMMEVEARRLELDAVEERRLQRLRQHVLDWKEACKDKVVQLGETMEALMEEAKDRLDAKKGAKKKKKGKK